MYKKPADMPAPPHWLFYALVTDLTASMAAARGAGATILNGPMEVPGGRWIVQGKDSQGGHFALHHVTG